MGMAEDTVHALLDAGAADFIGQPAAVAENKVDSVLPRDVCTSHGHHTLAVFIDNYVPPPPPPPPPPSPAEDENGEAEEREAEGEAELSTTIPATPAVHTEL